jgi:heme/copper-type cytochrome/quinol oxidase subunit 4
MEKMLLDKESGTKRLYAWIASLPRVAHAAVIVIGFVFFVFGIYLYARIPDTWSRLVLVVSFIIVVCFVAGYIYYLKAVGGQRRDRKRSRTLDIGFVLAATVYTLVAAWTVLLLER